MTLLTWTNFSVTRPPQRTGWCHKFGHKRAGRPFPRSAKTTIFTFHHPPATLQEPIFIFLPIHPWIRLSSSLLRLTPTGAVENIRQPSRPALMLTKVRFTACLSSLDHMISNYLILWHSRPNISTGIMSTLPAKADVQMCLKCCECSIFMG